MAVSRLQDISSEHVKQVGGKAARLGELHQAGHPVPPGFVIAAEKQHITPELLADILATYDELGLAHVAVRSSGVGEDGKAQSWAGQFATVLHVNRNNLQAAIETCWESVQAIRAKAYSGQQLRLAVLVQQMIHSESSGVAFSVNPVTGDRGEIMIEAIYGLGELLVQGLATPDNYILNKKTGDLLARDIAVKTRRLTFTNQQTTELDVLPKLQNLPVLNAQKLHEIAGLIRAIESYYGFAVDIEWAFQNNKLYLLQARPITTL